MTPRRPSSLLLPPLLAAAALVGALSGLGQGCSKRLPHGGDDPIYPLLGKHAAVPCEGCHGPGTPKTLPTACIDCHDTDRPSPTHHPGQDCAECHVVEGWEVVQTGHTGLTPPPETGPTTEDVHASLAPDRLCWDCHEVDRKDPTHYGDPTDQTLSWDCGPCHATTSWTDGLYVHPARTPHGTSSGGAAQDPSAWVVACADCHPASLKEFDCESCHLDIYPHYGDSLKPGPLSNGACLGCHPAGDL